MIFNSIQEILTDYTSMYINHVKYNICNNYNILYDSYITDSYIKISLISINSTNITLNAIATQAK